LHRRELGQKVGFPRFKSANRWHSIQLRQYGPGRDVYLDPSTGRLRVPKKLGRHLKVKQHRPLEGTPRPRISSIVLMGIGTSSSSATSGRRPTNATGRPWGSTWA
jgi:hypothetical protein